MSNFETTRSLREDIEERKLQQAKARREQQQKRLKRLAKAGATLAIIAALVVVGAGWLGPVRLAPVGDAWRLAGRRGAGFPVDFSYSHTRQAALAGNGIALLGPTQFDILNHSAYAGVAFPQPYPQPSIRAAAGRVVLFDRGSGQLTLFSRSGELYSMNLEAGIFSVDLNRHGALAVATRSNSAASEIFVWDTNGQRRFAWACEREYPSALRLSDNGRSLAMCLIGAEQAAVYSRFVYFPLDATQPRTDLRLPGVWLYDTASISGGWLAVGDQAVYLIPHGATQPQVLSYEGRALYRFALQNNSYSAVLLEDWDNRALLRVYDRNGDLALEQSFGQRPLGVSARGRAVYVHFDEVLLRWQPRWGFRQSQELPPGTQTALVHGRTAYLLTVRQVEQLRIRWTAVEYLP